MSTAYEIVTESIIKQLESGVAPWRKPWRTETPANLVSKKEYRGINIFLLASQGYGSRHWITYRQAQALGGTVREGQHGCKVVFWKFGEYRRENQEKKETESHKSILLRYYIVFNLEQCDGIKSTDSLRVINPLEQCESIVKGMPNPPEFAQDARALLLAFDRHSRHAGQLRIPCCRRVLLDSLPRNSPLDGTSFSGGPRRDHESQPLRQ